ncbi:MAG: GlsB/YeaQ/YmgE family stress response membrane protein [Parasphingopyxis sp.]|nr:GlsB/YeaQ/YmgE family stress response membrane protein [Sphingomonadales bacterium]
MVGIIIAIVVGGIIGWLASLVMARDASMGIFWNIVVGIVGSFLGRFIGTLFGVGSTLTEFDPIGLLMSFIGAVVLLAIVNLVQRGRVR